MNRINFTNRKWEHKFGNIVELNCHICKLFNKVCNCNYNLVRACIIVIKYD